MHMKWHMNDMESQVPAHDSSFRFAETAQRHMHCRMPSTAPALAIAELPVQTKHFTWAK